MIAVINELLFRHHATIAPICVIMMQPYLQHKMKKFYTSLFFTGLTFLSLAQTSWKVDAGHGYCGFSLRYMLIGDYKGHFRNFEGKVQTKTEGDFTDALFSIMIEINSISAEVQGHEDMLKSNTFFDSAEYPFAFFRSTSVKPGKGKGNYVIEGDITIRDITKRVILNGVAAEKPVTNPYFSQTNYGITVYGTLKRSDFGVGDYSFMNEGGLVLGNDVNFTCTLILLKSDRIMPMAAISKVAVDEKDLAAYVGQYDYGKPGILSVTAEQGKLFAKLGMRPKKQVLPMGENKFFYEFQNYILEFVKDDKGKISKLIQLSGSGKTEANKISDTPQEEKINVKELPPEPNYSIETWQALMNKNYSQAIELGTKGNEAYPENPAIAMYLAHACAFSGQYEKALKFYKDSRSHEEYKGAFVRSLQEEFLFFRSRKYPVAAMDKIFKELAVEPAKEYKAMN
jgi:polyisoprenoid-binding protein YceI